MSFDLVPFGSLFSIPQKNGLTRPKNVRGHGVPMVNMGELFAHPRIINIQMDLVPLSNSEANFLLEKNDLLFARQSLVLSGAGQCSIFTGDGIATTFESHLIRCRLDKRVSNPLFYFYFFRSPVGRTAMEAIVEQGAGASGIRGSDLVKLHVPLLPKVLQDEIAVVLGTIDDRIALLRETNATLEAIAQALFKSWFVDFDPVRARQQGIAPEGMDAATAALFPDSFEESELGLVPSGWQVGTLASVTSVKGGFAYKSEAFGPLGSPVVKIKNIVGDGTVDLLNSQFIADDVAEKTKKFALADGDVVIAMTGATIGKTGVVVTETNQVPYLNQRVAKFEPNLKGRKNSWFIFVAFKSSFIFDQVVNTASGSAQPNISTSGIESVRLVIPTNHELLREFDNIVSPIFNSWIVNQKQVKTLATLRDTLLPRLISGQLRLPEAEAQLNEVAHAI